MRRRIPEILLFVLIIVSGCRPASAPAPASIMATSVPTSALFEDITEKAGIHFQHSNGAEGKFRFVEFAPAGCALFDYDNDGLLDILLLQSGSSTPSEADHTRPHCALYHNNGDGTFTDVTAGSGLERDLGYLLGVAVGDYDNDGYEDLFLTGYGRNILLHNNGGQGREPHAKAQSRETEKSGQGSVVSDQKSSTGGTLLPLFSDVTLPMGLDRVHGTGFATSAAFGDYDNDGRLDLYVCYYAGWKPEEDRPCLNEKRLQDYCSPELFAPVTHRLYHNDSNRFTDVSERTGITKVKGRGLAVAFTDVDNDGRQDIFVANDITPNMLWHNNGNGTFTEVAKQYGCAYGEGGEIMAGMGVSLADYDHSGEQSLFVTNFSGMPNTLFKNTGKGHFRDVSQAAGVAVPHLKFLAFGCEFLDYDADGWPDLAVANGSVYIHADTRLDGASYRERKQLFHNNGRGQFEEITDPSLLGGLAKESVARGLAVGDLDNDGRLDLVITSQNAPPQILRNRDAGKNHWIMFLTVGTKCNRDGRHARLTLEAGGMRQAAVVRAGSSYLSASDRRVYFGLGKAKRAEKVTVHWPDGTQETLKDIAADKIYTLTEGKGVTALR